MRAPYGLEIIESCIDCNLREERLFCNMSSGAITAFDAIKHSIVYPKGALVFVEGQTSRGIFVLCAGRVKLSTSSKEGKTLIIQIAEPGEVLGLSATVSSRPYEVTAESLDPCQVTFVKRDDFLQFLSQFGDVCLRVAQTLSNNYYAAYEHIRSLGLSQSVSEKLASLLLQWSAGSGKSFPQEIRVKMLLTHEEIAQMIGTSRETVTRLLGEFKSKRLIEVKGSTLTILDEAALKALVNL